MMVLMANKLVVVNLILESKDHKQVRYYEPCRLEEKSCFCESVGARTADLMKTKGRREEWREKRERTLVFYSSVE